MVMVDGQGCIVLINAQAERVFGYPRDQLLGEQLEKLVPERFSAHHLGYREGFFADPRPRPMGSGRDLFARRRDGSEFPVEIGLTPIDSGHGFMVLATVVDITGRKRLDERFRRVVEYAPSAMVMVDARTAASFWSTRRPSSSSAYARSALIGQAVELLVPVRLSHHHVDFRNGFFAVPQARPMGIGRDLFARRSDGSEFPVEIGLNPIETEEGSMVLASIVDITERRRAQQKLESALKEKTVLLNEVHHRVKNNLQVIASMLNLQASHTSDPRLRAILGDSQSRVRAMALTHQLLYERKDYSRIDLGDYLQRLTQLLGSYRQGRSKVVLQNLLPETPQYLDFERAIPCGLVVNELVSNAFKHAFPDERGGTIGIELRVANGEVEIVVADDGIGLPNDFDIGQIKSLGLQLVPLLIEQLAGTFTIEPGPGARFHLRFPSDPPRRDVP
jgi:PAS domain S-box-containing protein